MADPAGFLKHNRVDESVISIAERRRGFGEIWSAAAEDMVQMQASRCMDCGLPPCHAVDCPLHNRIPDWCGAVEDADWERAIDILHLTDNFPEITGRICGAPCEDMCTLGVSFEPVSIRLIERALADYAWRKELIVPKPPSDKSGFRVAVIGSGPAGLAAAQELARFGHAPTVFERNRFIGGALRYGIPEFVLPGKILNRRIGQLESEGVVFEKNVEIGRDISVEYMRRSFDAVLIAAGLDYQTVQENRAKNGQDGAERIIKLDALSMLALLREGMLAASAGELALEGNTVTVIGNSNVLYYAAASAVRSGANEVNAVFIEQRTENGRNKAHIPGLMKRLLKLLEEEGVRVITAGGVPEIQITDASATVTIDESAPFGSADTPDESTYPKPITLTSGLVADAMPSQYSQPKVLGKGFSLDTDKKGLITLDADGMTSDSGVFAAGDCVTGPATAVDAMAMGRWSAERINDFLYW